MKGLAVAHVEHGRTDQAPGKVALAVFLLPFWGVFREGEEPSGDWRRSIVSAYLLFGRNFPSQS